jgi:hypothetical protein
MQDLPIYYLFLKCNLKQYYFDKILSFAKSGCYTKDVPRMDMVHHQDVTVELSTRLLAAQ